ncbi:MAG: radical SAM protein [Phycisphaera sp.]|nr:radical SAM protein [Phycisphaera sp.]
MLYERFGLTLMVTHACNLRCTYCYTGAKLHKAMPACVGVRAIERAAWSVEAGGGLDLAFFGGEPLVEAPLIERLITYARGVADRAGIGLTMTLTTNGTVTTAAAMRVLTADGMRPVVSHDGLTDTHDRHRLTVAGQPTSSRVEATIARFINAGVTPRVNMVVRPDTLADAAAGVRHLRSLGVTHTDLSLDLWTTWSSGDTATMRGAVAACADVWREGLPTCGISCFDEKAARLAAVPLTRTARCGFGAGEIAVAPSGHLYPCERLIGADLDDNPMRLAGHAMDGGDDFLPAERRDAEACAGRSHTSCDACPVASMCSTTCRCSNYVRTGSTATPDRLLCLWNELVLRETLRVLRPLDADRDTESIPDAQPVARLSNPNLTEVRTHV